VFGLSRLFLRLLNTLSLLVAEAQGAGMALAVAVLVAIELLLGFLLQAVLLLRLL
jgi:hypothetical protein